MDNAKREEARLVPDLQRPALMDFRKRALAGGARLFVFCSDDGTRQLLSYARKLNGAIGNGRIKLHQVAWTIRHGGCQEKDEISVFGGPLVGPIFSSRIARPKV